MGVRVDYGGVIDWDYQTAGAMIGIRTAEGKIKRTATTGEYETLLSRRQYLYDASFLVALQGSTDTIEDCAHALENPAWPVFLGRKCCIPSEPVLVRVGTYEILSDALQSVPWMKRNSAADGNRRTLDTFIEHPAGQPLPEAARLVYDVPQVFGFHSHHARWVVHGQVTVPVQRERDSKYFEFDRGSRRVDYTSAQWRAARLSRLEHDSYLCVFCKSPAIDVHHADYTHVGHETDADLRSLCKICHDACTMLEYGQDMHMQRVDPSDPGQRIDILLQRDRLLTERRLGRRRGLLESARNTGLDFFNDVIDSTIEEDY
jgi:hypothetical protein